MKLSRLLVPAMMVAGLTVAYAGEGENAKRQEGRKDKAEAVAKEPRRTAPKGAEAVAREPKRDAPKDGEARQQRTHEEVRRQNVRQFNRPDDVGPQSMMIRMFEDSEICEQLGIAPEVREEIQAAFKKIDKKCDTKREALGDLQANQAKLLVDDASEEEIMAAVDKVWAARAEIAKMQISKLLILRSKLTEEQIKKIDKVRLERFRTRRMEQEPEGREGANKAPREGRGPQRMERSEHGEKQAPPPPKESEI